MKILGERYQAAQTFQEFLGTVQQNESYYSFDRRGVHFIVLEKHDVPVFSFRTYVDAGGVDELPGITGIAHMFEHMAFKGTERRSAQDIAVEIEALIRARLQIYSAFKKK